MAIKISSRIRSRVRRVLGYLYIVPLLFLLFSSGGIGTGIISGAMAVVVSGLFWLTRINEIYVPKPNNSLVDRIKERLFIEHAIVKVRSRAPKKVFFGGLAFPLLPIFALVGYNESVDKREAVIHELAHINALVYGFQAALFYFCISILALAFESMNIIGVVIAGACFIILLLFQEFIAFTRTKIISNDICIPARSINWSIVVKYIVVYSIWVSFIFIVFLSMVKVNNIFGLVLFFVGLWLLNKLFYKTNVFINKLYKHSKNRKLYK